MAPQADRNDGEPPLPTSVVAKDAEISKGKVKEDAPLSREEDPIVAKKEGAFVTAPEESALDQELVKDTA